MNMNPPGESEPSSGQNQARITRPQVRVDAQDRWFYADQAIVNPDVLAYFKLNLHRNAEGDYYIINRFGELLEHGYLDGVAGFPLIAESVTVHSAGAQGLELALGLDSREQLRVPADALRMYDEQTLGLLLPIPGREIPVRLGPLAMASLVDYLEPLGDTYRLQWPADPGRSFELQRGQRSEFTRDAGSA